MTRYALVKDNVTIDRFASNVDPTVLTKPGYRWMQCDPTSAPVFDPTSEKITGPTYIFNANDVTEVWTKVPMSAQEISDSKDVAITNLNRGDFNALFKILLNLNNRLRTLEGQPTMTIAQLKAAVKALL